jgi:hypothetical protein
VVQCKHEVPSSNPSTAKKGEEDCVHGERAIMEVNKNTKLSLLLIRGNVVSIFLLLLHPQFKIKLNGQVVRMCPAT